MDAFTAFLPLDRRYALATGMALPDRVQGAALFADISGFTPLTNTLARELGPRHGAEEVIHHLNRVYTALIDRVHTFGGDVINFSGDAITCWFDDTGLDSVARAVDCGFALQQVMADIPDITTPDGTAIPLAVKVAIAAGPARRFLVGDPDSYVIEVLAGKTLDEMAAAEKHTERGEVVVSAKVLDRKPDLPIKAWRGTGDLRYGLLAPPVSAMTFNVTAPQPIPSLDITTTRPWLLPPVYDHLCQTADDFLAQLRPAVSLFVRFSGIDYDGDDEAGQKLDIFIRQVQKDLNRYEGYLLQLTMGDKGSYLYASFGAPIAHEDDVSRAASAALSIRELVNDLKFLQLTQIGLSQGQTHSGTYGSPRRRTFGVLGSDVNISARLMAAATPGQILVSTRIAETLDDRFELESLPPLHLKGIDAPFPVWELRQRSKAIRPPLKKVFSPGGSFKVVGREQELTVLSQVLADLINRTSRTIIIEGAPGLGKSLLAQELLARAGQSASDALLTVTSAGDAVEQSTPYYVWRAIFERLFDWDAEDGSPSLEGVMDQLDPAVRALGPLLNAVLPLNLPENELTEQLRGETRQENTHQLLVQLMRLKVAGRPLLLVIDDAHWVDSVSWTLLRRIHREVEPLLLVVVTRPMGSEAPEVFGELIRHPATSHLALDTLPPAAIEELVGQRLGVSRLPPELSQFILQKAEGNPFFSEELAFALRDGGYLVIEQNEVRLGTGVADITQLDFPNTIQGIITSRIDLLPPQQQLTVKVASVIGRIFAFSVLRDIYPVSIQTEMLRGHLDRFERLDITLQETPEPNLSHIFKHIVTQEVVYSLMTFSQRQQLHRQTALWYEGSETDDHRRRFPLLAYHWHEAGDKEKSIVYYGKAGENAFRDYANQEAIKFLTQALALSGDGGSSFERARWHRLIGEASYRLTLMQQSREHYETALALLDKPVSHSVAGRGVGLAGELVRQVWYRWQSGRSTAGQRPDERERWLEAARGAEGLGEVFYNDGDMVGSFYCVMGALNLAEQAGPSPELLRGYANMCATMGTASFYGMAERYRRRALSMADSIDDLPAKAWIQIPLSTYSLWIGAWDRAEAEINEALDIYARLGEWRGWGVAAWLWPQVAQSRGDLRRARDLWSELYVVARRHGDTRHQVRSNGGQYFNHLALGEVDAAEQCLVSAGRTLEENPEMKPIEERLWLGMNAINALRHEEWAQAREYAREQLAAIGRARFKFDLLDVFAAPAEVFLALWEQGWETSKEAQAGIKVLNGYARTYPFARPRALRNQGFLAWLDGNHRQAEKLWQKSLAQADKLAMPEERAKTQQFLEQTTKS